MLPLEWKEFGTCYRVSNSGIVQSKAKSDEWFNKKLKKSKTDQHGGYYMTFCMTGTHVRLHRFMWETFKGPIPPKMVINHIDGDRENNAIWNLECVTQSENMKNLIARGNFRGFRRKSEPQEENT